MPKAKGKAREERMAVIVRAAADAFQERGFHGASLQDIADSLNITKGGLYYYVASKDELLYECHRLAMELVLPGLEEIAAATDIDPREKIRRAVLNHLAVLTDEFNVVMVLLQQEYALPPKARRKIADLRNRYDTLLAGIIEEGTSAGIFREEMNSKMATYCLVGCLNWIPHWYKKTGVYSLEEIGEMFTSVFLEGVCSRSPTAAGT